MRYVAVDNLGAFPFFIRDEMLKQLFCRIRVRGYSNYLFATDDTDFHRQICGNNVLWNL